MQIIQGIFDEFGGISPLARALNVPISTVHSWKDGKSGIPVWHRSAILDAARVLDRELTDDAIIYLSSREKIAA